MGNTLGRENHGRALLSAVGNGNTTMVQQMLDECAELAFYTPLYSRRTPCFVAAERGDLEVLRLVHEAAQRAPPAAKLCLDQSGPRMRTALMTACQLGHLDCVDYLLLAGADATVVTYNVRRETALHLACANAHSSCVQRLLESSVMDPSGLSSRLANIVSVNGARYIDAVNGSGLCALHLATLQGSASTVRALIRAGASLDTQIAGGRSRPTSNWMCAGSTALHLACARGIPAIAAILLDAQAANPGAADLRRIRNSRGLKPSQVARLEGHHDIARLLHAAPPPPGIPPRRSRRAVAELRAAPSLEALMQLLVARAKLLLSLRSVVQAQRQKQGAEAAEGPTPGSAAPVQPQSMPDSAPATAAAGGGRRDTTMDILHLLASLDFTQGGSDGGAGSGADAGVGEGGIEAARIVAPAELAPGDATPEITAPSGRTYRSYAATALMQAALDAIEAAARAGPEGLAAGITTPAGDVAPDLFAAAAEATAESWEAAARSSGRRRRRRHRPMTAAASLDELFPSPQPAYDPLSYSWVPPEVGGGGTSLASWWRARRERRRRRSASLPPATPDTAEQSFSAAEGGQQGHLPVAAAAPTSSLHSLFGGRQAAEPGLDFSVDDGAPLAAGGSSAAAPVAAGSSSTAGEICPVPAAAAGNVPSSNGGAVGGSISNGVGGGSVLQDVRSPAASELSVVRSGESSSSGEDEAVLRPKPCKVSPVAAGSGWQCLANSASGDADAGCAICMDAGVEVAVGGCGHGLCVKCAYRLCARGGLALPCCPFCRSTIAAFETADEAAKAAMTAAEPVVSGEAAEVAAAWAPAPAAQEAGAGRVPAAAVAEVAAAAP